MTSLARGAFCAFASANSISHLVREAKPETFRRLISYRQNCKFLNEPKCNLTNIQKSACVRDIVLPDHPLSAIWDKPDCCREPCKDANSRFDDLYYFISDKSKRKYTRTWKECPKVMRCKKVCCFDGKERSPPFKKRPKTHVIDTACPATPDCMALTGKACSRIKCPGCKPVRIGNCKKFIRPLCEKFCTPYPSFSECMKEIPKKLNDDECSCTKEPMHCELVGKEAPLRLQRCN